MNVMLPGAQNQESRFAKMVLPSNLAARSLTNWRNEMNFAPKTGDELQQARKAAAARYAAIAMNWLPEGWTVQYRKSLSGRCYYLKQMIVAPKPVTRRALHIFLHECGHAHLHGPSKKHVRVHVREMEAEQFAFDKMREAGVAIPDKSRARAKSYVRRKIKQAVRCGAKKIDPRATAFAR